MEIDCVLFDANANRELYCGFAKRTEPLVIEKFLWSAVYFQSHGTISHPNNLKRRINIRSTDGGQSHNFIIIVSIA